MTGRNGWSSWRHRAERRALALDPTPEGFAALARDLAADGAHGAAARVAAEGFSRFPIRQELRFLYMSARTLDLERRRRRSFGGARGARTAELVGLHLIVGDLRAAKAVAEEWCAQRPVEPGPKIALARVKLAHFRANRESEDGLEGLALLEEAAAVQPSTATPYRLLAELAAEVGAWRAALLYAARWRALAPHDPAAAQLETRLDAHRTSASPDLSEAIRREAGMPAPSRPPTPAEVGAEARARLRALVETEGVDRAAHPSLGLVEARPGRTVGAWERTVRGLTDSGLRMIVRLGLGEPVSFLAGGREAALAVGFGPAGAVVADCRGFSVARRIEPKVLEAALGARG